MRTFTAEDLDQIKKKWGLDSLVIGEIEIEGKVIATLPLTPFDLPGFDRYTDESLKDHDAANEALVFRAVRFYTVSELNKLRAACASLPAQVFALLAGDAGFATQAPARYQVDAFDTKTPPLVLEQAGLDVGTAEKLVADLGGQAAKIVTVVDHDERVIFGGVLAAPGEAEQHILRKAKEAKSGFGAACRSAAAGCLRWSAVDPEMVWKRYPAIPVMHLADTIGDMGGASATRRFRRG